MSEAQVKQAIATFTYDINNNNEVTNVVVTDLKEDADVAECISKIEKKIPVDENNENRSEEFFKILKEAKPISSEKKEGGSRRKRSTKKYKSNRRKKSRRMRK